MARQELRNLQEWELHLHHIQELVLWELLHNLRELAFQALPEPHQEYILAFVRLLALHSLELDPNPELGIVQVFVQVFDPFPAQYSLLSAHIDLLHIQEFQEHPAHPEHLALDNHPLPELQEFANLPGQLFALVDSPVSEA